jgi:hypothetical protein
VRNAVIPPADVVPGVYDIGGCEDPSVAYVDGMLPVMFYNRATRAAEWRTGWVVFDRTFTRVVDRCTMAVPASTSA